MGQKLAALSRGLPGLGMAIILDFFHLDGTTPVKWQYVKSEDQAFTTLSFVLRLFSVDNFISLPLNGAATYSNFDQ